MLADDIATLCEAAAERWQQHMLRGYFEEAWRESDFIAAIGHEDPHRFWNGESWAGKRIMLRCLHGLGDTIQFIRYAPLLRQTCRSLTTQSHPRLVSLLERVPGVDRAVAWEEDETDWELQMEVNELPRIFRTRLSTIPCSIPYVLVSERKLAWAKRIAYAPRETFKVGLIWTAGEWNQRRSLPPSELTPLLRIPGCTCYVLQKNPDEPIGAIDIECHASDVADSAALMSQMDLIVSVDTMAAHLAGALGKPVWVLLPVKADWRWMLDRSDSPWYPTMRLFRQEIHSDWRTPIARAASQLKQLLHVRGTGINRTAQTL